MKVRASIKKMCRNCKIIKRMCEENEGMNYEFWFFKALDGEFAIKKRGGKMELKGAGATYYLE